MVTKELLRFAWAFRAVCSDNGWWHTDVGYIGLRVSLSSLWIGLHWSSYNKRLCINLLPCITLWVTLPGGTTP